MKKILTPLAPSEPLRSKKFQTTLILAFVANSALSRKNETKIVKITHSEVVGSQQQSTTEELLQHAESIFRSVVLVKTRQNKFHKNRGLLSQANTENTFCARIIDAVLKRETISTFPQFGNDCFRINIV